MSLRNGESWQSGPRERSPLMPGHHQPSYGASGPVPRAPDLRPPPPYSTTHGHSNDQHQTPRAYSFKQDPPPRYPYWIAIVLLIIGTLVFNFFASLFCYDLPNKIGQYNDEIALLRQEQNAMIRQARHLEKDRIALRNESTRLENERLALDSSTLKMEGERLALESVIRHSEQERSKLEKQKQLMEAEKSRLSRQTLLLEHERQLLEREELTLREERERWERARDEQTIPQGAFWEPVSPAWECRAYGRREYWGLLHNVPEGRTELDACMNMPVEIRGVTIRRPDRCEYVSWSSGMHGFWMVDWDQPDCKPWHENFVDRGCVNPGSGLRRIEAEVVGINNKGWQDWRLLCETTPMIWNHVTYTSPDHCDDHGKKIATWHVADDRC